MEGMILTSILNIMASVGGQSLGDNEQGISKCLDTRLGLALDRLGEVVALQVSSAGNLERASTRNNALIDNHVVDTPQSVSDGISHLRNGVLVRALDHEGHRLGVLDLLDKGILLLAQCLLVDKASPSKNIRRQVFNAVLSDAAADQLQSLHVSSLGTTKSENAVLGQNIQRQRIDALLVDNDKVLLAISSTEFLLQFDNLLQLGVDESALTLHELIALVSAGVKEAGIDFGLLVLQANVHSQNVAVLESLGHIWVASAVVQGKTTNELSVSSGAVLHLHDFDHVQVWLRRFMIDGKNGVDNGGCELLCKC